MLRINISHSPTAVTLLDGDKTICNIVGNLESSLQEVVNAAFNLGQKSPNKETLSPVSESDVKHEEFINKTLDEEPKAELEPEVKTEPEPEVKEENAA
jgi:hypothetical protein